MIKLNLQFFGGRGGSGGKRTSSSNESNTNTDTLKIKGGPTVWNRIKFTKDLGGTWGATFGTLTTAQGERIREAVQLRIVPGRENGKNYYTTRFIVMGGGRDWQYSDERYPTLKAAQEAVKSDARSYIDEELRKNRR